MTGCAQDAQDVPPNPSVMQRAAAGGFGLLQFVRGCLREGGYGQPWTGLLNVWGHIAVLGICVAERCRVSRLNLHGLVKSSPLQCCNLVVRGGETRVDRFGQAEATGRGGCLAC